MLLSAQFTITGVICIMHFTIESPQNLHCILRQWNNKIFKSEQQKAEHQASRRNPKARHKAQFSAKHVIHMKHAALSIITGVFRGVKACVINYISGSNENTYKDHPRLISIWRETRKDG